MITFYYISIISFCLYIAGNVLKYGIPESLSETAYLNKKYGPHFFLLFCLFTAFPLMIFWLTISAGQTFQFLAFLSCVSLIGVACAWKYKEGFDRKLHMISAAITAICSLLWSFIYTPIWPITILMAVILLSFGYKIRGLRTEGETENSIIFFSEIGAFLNLYISTYIFYLLM